MSIKSKTTPLLEVTVAPPKEFEQEEPDEGEVECQKLAQQMAKLHPPEEGGVTFEAESNDDTASHMSQQNSHHESQGKQDNRMVPSPHEFVPDDPNNSSDLCLPNFPPPGCVMHLHG